MKTKVCILLFLLVLPFIAFAAKDYTVIADSFKGTENLAFDAKGNLYVSDTTYLGRILPDGRIEKVYNIDKEKDGISLGGVSLGPDGDIYFSVGNRIMVLSPEDGKTEEFVSGLSFANGNCFDDKGNFFIANSERGTLYVVRAGTRKLEVLYENEGNVKGLGINGLVWDRKENELYYTSNFPARVGKYKLGDDLKVISNTVVAKFGNTKIADDLTLDQEGNVFVCLWGGGKVFKVMPDGAKEVILDKLAGPSALAFGVGKDQSSLYITIKGKTLAFKGTQVIKVEIDTQGYKLPFLP
jgi:sugar lactone lactonase YvrE